MTTFGILFVQKRPLKDGHQNFVQNWTARVVNWVQNPSLKQDGSLSSAEGWREYVYCIGESSFSQFGWFAFQRVGVGGGVYSLQIA